MTEEQISDIIRRTALLVAEELRKDVTRELMTKTQLADYLQCDTSTINRAMVHKENPLPFEQFGGVPRFRKASIDKWLSIRDSRVRRSSPKTRTTTKERGTSGSASMAA